MMKQMQTNTEKNINYAADESWIWSEKLRQNSYKIAQKWYNKTKNVT